MFKLKTKEIIEKLNVCYPDAKPALIFDNVFELLVAVILSAQCTDVRVNKVTAELFSKYKTAEDFARLSAEELEPQIRSCGLGASKAKGIVSTSKILVEKYGGQVPSDIAILRTLPSVGRKTANVVASVGFGIPAIAVDTHVFRVSNRIGLADAKDVVKTELQLQKAIDKNMWSKAHHLLILHGRNVCKAQKPNCEMCEIKEYCKFNQGRQQDVQNSEKK